MLIELYITAANRVSTEHHGGIAVIIEFAILICVPV